MHDITPQIFVLGGLRIRKSESVITPPLTGSARELLSYLCTHVGKELRRERIADLVWRDLDEIRSRAALNTAVWRINKFVRTCADLRLSSSAEYLCLEAANGACVDATILEAAVRRAIEAWNKELLLPEDVRRNLVAGIALYVAPFLENCASEWALVERERLLILHLRGLSMLMQDCGMRRDYEGALEYGNLILSADPFREQVQCEVMWLHVLSGQRAKALKQYSAYRALLAREMGIEPMAEMRALATHIENDPDAEQRLVEGRLGETASSSRFAILMESVSRARHDTYRTLQTG
jgi:DNA-binding SARP family transcriptional activator